MAHVLEHLRLYGWGKGQQSLCLPSQAARRPGKLLHMEMPLQGGVTLCSDECVTYPLQPCAAFAGHGMGVGCGAQPLCPSAVFLAGMSQRGAPNMVLSQVTSGAIMSVHCSGATRSRHQAALLAGCPPAAAGLVKGQVKTSHGHV